MIHQKKESLYQNKTAWCPHQTALDKYLNILWLKLPKQKSKIKKEYLYKEHLNFITRYLEKVEDILGIPHFPLHKLRYYFASKISVMNIPEADIMKMGSRETDHVMKSVYRHSMIEKEEHAKREAAEKLRNALFS